MSKVGKSGTLMNGIGLVQSSQIRKWGFRRANLLDRYINNIGLTFSSQTESPQGIYMSKEEFIEKFNNASEEVKNLVSELLTDHQQLSESLE